MIIFYIQIYQICFFNLKKKNCFSYLWHFSYMILTIQIHQKSQTRNSGSEQKINGRVEHFPFTPNLCNSQPWMGLYSFIRAGVSPITEANMVIDLFVAAPVQSLFVLV